MAWRRKQLTTDEASRVLTVDVVSDKEDFQEAEVIFLKENDSDVDASSDPFFEILETRMMKAVKLQCLV